MRRVIVRFLSELGYRLLHADQATSAMEVLRQRDDVVLLLTDVVLPGGMNGIELGQWAKKTCPTVNVIYASGYAAGATRAAPPGEPQPDILSKPFALDDLAVQVRGAIGPAPLDGTSTAG